jgi:WD40 repeat protein
MRVKAAERATLLLQLEKEIRPPHIENWSDRAWQMASDAAAKFGFDTNLQSQAAATLAGLDAKCLFETNGVGGSSVAFSADGKRVLFGALDDDTTNSGKAHLLDLTTTNLSAFPVPGEGPVAFLSDGAPVQFSENTSHGLALWKVGQRVSPAPLGTNSPSQASPIPPDGSRDGLPYLEPAPLRYFTLPTGESIGGIIALALTPDGGFVAASGTNTLGNAFLAAWNNTSGHLLFRTNLSASVLTLAPDGSLLAAGNDSGEVTVWHVSDGNQLPTITAGRLSIRSLTFCRDFVRDPLHPAKELQWLLAVGDSGDGVAIWEVPAQRLRTPCRGAPWERTTLAFSPDGTLLASGGREPIVIWDTATGNPVTTIAEDYVAGISFSAEGTKFTATRERGNWAPRTRVWEMENGRGIRTLRGLSRQVARVCFSADSKLLAAVAHDWQVGVWDLSSNRLLHVFHMPQGLYTADNTGLAFSSDGSQLAFMAGTNAVLIDVVSGVLTQKWCVPPGRVDELAFDSHDRLLAFHFESNDTDAKKLVRPTVARIRKLLPDGNLRVLSTLKEFNYDVRHAMWSHEGSFVVVEGSRLANGLTNRFVEAVTPDGIKPLWTRPSRQPWNAGQCAVLDTAGRYVAITDGQKLVMDFVLREAQTGDLVRPLTTEPRLLNSASDHICIGPGAGGLDLLSLSEEAVLLSLQHLASTRSFFPVFSLDGSLLAWGNQDGTVFVCDLDTMRLRLDGIKLGWRLTARQR